MGVIVNTGRKAVEVAIGSVWKSREKRGAARRVRVTAMSRTHVAVRNTGSNRLAKIHLQDFVARFDLEAGT